MEQKTVYAEYMTDVVHSNKNQYAIITIDTEFFYGISNQTLNNAMRNIVMNITQRDIDLLPLYNLGLHTHNTNYNILVKHPLLTIRQRFDLFTNFFNRDKTFKVLQNVVHHYINQRGEQINENELSMDVVNYYFEKYAINYEDLNDILPHYINPGKIIVYHYCVKDHLFLHQLLMMNNANFINQLRFINTRTLCQALFPIERATSHSLMYLVDNLLTKKAFNDKYYHTAGYDAKQLWSLYVCLAGKLNAIL